MTRVVHHFAAACCVLLLAACSAPAQRGTEVTRFHLNESIAKQAVAIEPIDPADRDSLAFRNYATVVADELARAGFSRTDREDSELVARLKVTRGTRTEAPKRSPFSIGIGGAGSNVGVGTSVGLGGSGGKDIAVTELQLRLESRSESQVLWEGTATRAMEPGAEAQSSETVRGLAAALLADFPGKSGETIMVN